MSEPRPLILDVDTGTDDALALAYAVRSPEIDLVAVTTVAGNVGVERTTANTLAVLDWLGASDVPVHRGASRPLVRPHRDAIYFHDEGGLGGARLPAGYRSAGKQAVRVDIAEKVLRAAHQARAESKARRFVLDPALAVSTGLAPESWRRLLGAAGFRHLPARKLPDGKFGPPAPDLWEWRPTRRTQPPARPERKPPANGAFAALAELKVR